MLQLNPYLNFNGNCAEAFQFYEKALGGKNFMSHTFGGSPMASHVPPDAAGKIMHARMDVGDSTLMGSDGIGDRYKTPAGMAVSLSTEDPAEADRIFQALSDGAKIEMPIQKTFWAERFGMLTDRFGIPWMINCEPKKP
jgi:PhnB protein